MEFTNSNETDYNLSVIIKSGSDEVEEVNVGVELPPEYRILPNSAWPAIIAYLVVFIVASVGNLLEFYAVWRRLRTRCTPMNILLMNLCVADILVVISVGAIEVFWRISIGWYAGAFLCKLVQFFRAFGLYLSSLVLICLTLDRYYAVLHPLKVVDASVRVKIMLIIAWILAALLASPQSWIFIVQSHPQYPQFVQCTSSGETAEFVNTVVSLCFMYFLPFFLIVFSYGNIIYALTNENHSGRGGMRLRRSDGALMDRAKIRALKLTFVIVVAFILCWTPYVVITMWHIIDRESAEQLNPFLQDALFIMVVANSCANPLVYGVFHSGRKPAASSNSTVKTSAYTMSTLHRRSTRIPSFPANSPNNKSLLGVTLKKGPNNQGQCVTQLVIPSEDPQN